jgi:hypothetical protein
MLGLKHEDSEKMFRSVKTMENQTKYSKFCLCKSLSKYTALILYD